MLSSRSGPAGSFTDGRRPTTQIRWWLSISGWTAANGLSMPRNGFATAGDTAIAKSLVFRYWAG